MALCVLLPGWWTGRTQSWQGRVCGSGAGEAPDFWGWEGPGGNHGLWSQNA